MPRGAAYLETACGGDELLRQRVVELLAAHDASEQASSSFAPIPNPPPLGPLSESARLHDRPLQAAGTDRRRGLWAWCSWPSRQQPVQRQGGAQDHQAGHGHAASDRPLRGRAAGPGDDGPPQHRQGARCRDDRNRPTLFRHGTGQGRSDHRLLRRTASAAPPAAGAVSARFARPCSTPIRKASSTATSSPRTCWWRTTTASRSPK